MSKFLTMKDKIVERATELFFKMGFKSVTMDDIAADMSISKKTIYKYFSNKEDLVSDSVTLIHGKIMSMMHDVIAKDYNPIKENFEIRNMFKEMFHIAEASPVYQLRKFYPEIYQHILQVQFTQCKHFVQHNLEKGIERGYYRADINVTECIDFYYTLMFHINETSPLEREAWQRELYMLEYHTRAIGTPKGISELESYLSIPNI